jgi:aminopeptidase N
LYGELPEAAQEAEKRFLAMPLDQLDAELRVGLMAHAVRHTLKADIVDTLLETYKTAINSELRDDIAAALTSTRDSAVITRLASLLKDTSFIRPQDFTHWFVWLLRNRYGRNFLWQWARDNWQWISDTFKGDSHYDMFPRYIAGSLVTAEQLEEYKAFFAPLEKEIALKRNIAIGYTELRGIVRLLETDGPKVRQTLKDIE